MTDHSTDDSTDDYLVLVVSNPVAGREAEFDEWYEHPHLDQVIETAGFRTARRFVLEAGTGAASKHRHLAVYETRGSSAQEVLDRLDRTRPDRVQTDAIDASGAGVWVFAPTGELHTAPIGGDADAPDDAGLFEIMSTCRAMRRLAPDPVPEPILHRLVEAAGFAPSGRNLQRARWILVRSAEQKAAVAALNRRASEESVSAQIASMEALPHQDRDRRRRMYEAVLWQTEHMHEAPALIVACCILDEPDQSPYRYGSSVWPGIQNLLLAARAHGLGAVPTTYALQFRAELSEVLRLPPRVCVQAIIPVGYPTGNFGPVRRLPVSEVLMDEHWSGPVPAT